MVALSFPFRFATRSPPATSRKFASFRLCESGPSGLSGLPSQSNSLWFRDSLPASLCSKFSKSDSVRILLHGGVTLAYRVACVNTFQTQAASQPSLQFRTPPLKPDVPPQPQMREWISLKAPQSGLLSNPGDWNTEFLGEFFRCEQLESLLRNRSFAPQLLSTHLSPLRFSYLQRLAVWRTAAIPASLKLERS